MKEIRYVILKKWLDAEKRFNNNSKLIIFYSRAFISVLLYNTIFFITVELPTTWSVIMQKEHPKPSLTYKEIKLLSAFKLY